MRKLSLLAAALAACAACGPTTGDADYGQGRLMGDSGLRYDVPGVPNEPGEAIQEKLRAPDVPLETKYAYFSHYSPVVRRLASAAMASAGDEAMPFVLRGLRSGDRHRIRAACDAISGFEGWSYRRMKSKIPTDAAAEAVPDLVAALDHERLYIRDGALHALARCGKAPAPHLPKIAAFLADDEWWLRSSAALAILAVGSPEADAYAVPLAEAMLGERHIMCLNDMSHALKGLMKSMSTHGEVAKALGRGLEGMERAYVRQRGRDVLDVLGAKGKEALPFINLLIAEEERYVEKAEKAGTLGNWDKWDLDNLKKTRAKLVGKE
ncbi:MAG: HEAT repeat domain-containing protein [Planctomycetota bacterium]|jgi:hypothetical protein